MRAPHILILAVTVVVVVAVGAAVAASYAAGDGGPRPPAAAGAETPPATDVQQSMIPDAGTDAGRSESIRATSANAVTSPVAGDRAAQPPRENARDCPDDCGDGGGVHAASRASAPAVDDDGDGDGGDCGEGD